MPNDLPDWAQVVARPDTILPGSPYLYNAGSTSELFTMPTGVHLLSVVLQDYPDVTELMVVGVATGVVYLYTNPAQEDFQHQYYALIPEGADTEVQVTTVASVAGRAWVTGVSDTVAVAMLPQNPAPWQAPNRKPIGFTFANPGAGASVQIIAAPSGGQSIWIHALSIMWSAAVPTANGHFQDGAGQIIMEDAPLAVGIPRYMHFGGVKLSGNNNLQFKQAGAGAASSATCFGSVSYAVY